MRSIGLRNISRSIAIPLEGVLMNDFISAIPEAAKSSYALFAYALALAALIFGGSGLRELKLIMRRYAAGKHSTCRRLHTPAGDDEFQM